MVSSSAAGPNKGIERPDDIEIFHVEPEELGYMAPHGRPTMIVMWHGNGYKRDDCWLQADVDVVCDLITWK